MACSDAEYIADELARLDIELSEERIERIDRLLDYGYSAQAIVGAINYNFLWDDEHGAILLRENEYKHATRPPPFEVRDGKWQPTPNGPYDNTAESRGMVWDEWSDSYVWPSAKAA